MIKVSGEMMPLLMIMMMMDTNELRMYFYAASGEVSVLNDGGSKFFVP